MFTRLGKYFGESEGSGTSPVPVEDVTLTGRQLPLAALLPPFLPLTEGRVGTRVGVLVSGEEEQACSVVRGEGTRVCTSGDLTDLTRVEGTGGGVGRVGSVRRRGRKGRRGGIRGRVVVGVLPERRRVEPSRRERDSRDRGRPGGLGHVGFRATIGSRRSLQGLTRDRWGCGRADSDSEG